MRRGSVSSWEPWARRNSANMAQIPSSRSEFITSDAGVSDIEYKRKGGCFVSYKKIVVVVFALVIGIIAAGIIGAYYSPWSKRSPTSVTIAEEDQIEGGVTPAKFSVSSSILPTLYSIELTPVINKDTVEKLKGRVKIRFNYNETKPLSQLVLNAKNITVFESKLFSNEDPVPKNVHSRRRRDDAAVSNSNSSEITTVTSLPEVTANDIDSESSSGSDGLFNVTTMSIANETASDSSIENITTTDTSSLTTTTANSITITNDQSYSVEVEEIPSTTTTVANRVTTPFPSTKIYTETPPQGTEILITKNETDTVDDFYVIYPDTPIKRGAYSLEITYEAQIDGENTFANVYHLDGQTRWILASKLKPLGTRTLFPSLDDPNLNKARFSLSLARPDTLIAVANMPLQSSKPSSQGWLMDRFEESLPLASHNLAFVIGDLQPVRETTIADTEIPITIWDRSNRVNETDYMVDKINKVTKNLNQLFSTPYLMPKLDFVILPGLRVDSIGSTGLVSIRESLFFLTEKSSPIMKELAIRNLIKVIAEQWLGGFVSARTFSDSWIMEGSSIYLQHILVEKIDPTLDSSASFGIIQHESMEVDSYDGSKTLEIKLSLTNLETTNLQNTYKKGACLIRMLHNVISDSGFTNGYKKFLSRWMNSSAGVTDFLDAMSNQTTYLPDGVSLNEVMTSWITQGGFPVITVTRNYENASAVVRQEQFAYDNSTSTSSRRFWYIPLTYVKEGDDWSLPNKSWLKQEESLTLEKIGKGGEKKWVLFNVNKTGYHRVNYDLDNWNLLSSALNSTFEKFPVTTRTSLVDDALSLAWGGRLGYPTALNLIRYLHEKETHHSPWTVALRNMIKLNNLLHNTPAYSSFQEFMVKFISPLLKKVTRTGEESRIKLMAIKWVCLVDNPQCRSYVKSLSTVPTYLEETHRCTLAKFGTKSEFDALLSETLNSTDKEKKFQLLRALPCFKIEWILQSLLTDILKGERFDEQESLALLQSFGNNPTATRSAFRFVQRHWDDIFERFSKSYPISKAFLIAAINGITDDQDLKELQDFKDEHFEKLKFMAHTIAVGEAEARSRNSWLKMNLVSVKTWLQDYVRRTS